MFTEVKGFRLGDTADARCEAMDGTLVTPLACETSTASRPARAALRGLFANGSASQQGPIAPKRRRPPNFQQANKMPRQMPPDTPASAAGIMPHLQILGDLNVPAG